MERNDKDNSLRGVPAASLRAWNGAGGVLRDAKEILLARCLIPPKAVPGFPSPRPAAVPHAQHRNPVCAGQAGYPRPVAAPSRHGSGSFPPEENSVFPCSSKKLWNSYMPNRPVSADKGPFIDAF